MSDDNKEPVKLATEAFRHEMKAGEKIKLLFQENGKEVGEQAMEEAFRSIMSNVETKGRAEGVVSVMDTFATQMQSENLMRAVLEVADESPYLELEDEV